MQCLNKERGSRSQSPPRLRRVLHRTGIPSDLSIHKALDPSAGHPTTRPFAGIVPRLRSWEPKPERSATLGPDRICAVRRQQHEAAPAARAAKVSHSQHFRTHFYTRDCLAPYSPMTPATYLHPSAGRIRAWCLLGAECAQGSSCLPSLRGIAEVPMSRMAATTFARPACSRVQAAVMKPLTHGFSRSPRFALGSHPVASWPAQGSRFPSCRCQLLRGSSVQRTPG